MFSLVKYAMHGSASLDGKGSLLSSMALNTSTRFTDLYSIYFYASSDVEKPAGVLKQILWFGHRSDFTIAPPVGRATNSKQQSPAF